ncbi:hypothetical protein MMC17_002255 [Xylographa soralifera]|nr:hypothetical protein [Xylographa soralifera]
MDGLTRALALLIEKCNPLSNGALVETIPWDLSMRMRTRRGYRRLLFQSLAEPDPAAPAKGVRESNDPNHQLDFQENRFYDAGRGQSCDIDVSMETPDMTDSLDALAITQPNWDKPGVKHVPRAAFEHITANIPRSHVHLAELRIPKTKLQAVVSLILAVHPVCLSPGIEQYTSSTEEFGRAVASLMLSFGDGSSKHISWKVFNRTLAQSMPLLENGLSHLFSYFVMPSTDELKELRPLLMLLQPVKVLTPPLLSQLCYFLPPGPHFGTLQLIYGENKVGLSQVRSDALVASVATWKGPSILLVAGSSSITDAEVGKRTIIGAFIPTPWNVKQDTDFGAPGSSIFQLRPVQEVFRAKWNQVGEHARFSDHALYFGNKGGVRLILDMSSQSGNLIHSGEGDGDYASYFDEELPKTKHFTIEEVEVWGFEDKWVRAVTPEPQ